MRSSRDKLWPVGDPLANPRKGKSNRPLSGLCADFRLRRPTYLEDWTAGLQSKTIGATLFLYFACLAPVVAFGGALQVATCGQFGIVETILSRGVCGMAYAAFSGRMRRGVRTFHLARLRVHSTDRVAALVCCQSR